MAAAAAAAVAAGAAYVPVLGGTVIATGISENDSMVQILHWIGFRTPAQNTALYDDSVDGWDSIKNLSMTDVDAMAKSFAARSTRKIIFGTNRTKFLKATIQWVRDFYRVSQTPTIVDLTETTFKLALRTAESRANIRKTLKDANNIPSDASPGLLVKESLWKDWEEKFENYLRLHLGASGVPLSYVIRENDNPDTTTVFTDFIRKTIACAPLNGEHYDADKLTVFNFIVSFTTGQPSGDWVKETAKFSNGRRSMKALRAHFLGEGNKTRSLTSAESLRSTLHYKNERSMTFESFLTQCQKMFYIFDQQKEPMSEDAKIRFLFLAIQHQGLQVAVAALRAQRTAGTTLSYTACCNHLQTAVSELPEFIQRNRQISQVKVSSVSKGSGSIYNADGTINATGQIKDWNTLPMSDKRLVYKERKKLGVKYGSNGGGKAKKGSKTTFNSASDNNTIQQLRKQNNSLKRKIKAISIDTPDEEKDDEAEDAGDEFGGKNSKKKKN